MTVRKVETMNVSLTVREAEVRDNQQNYKGGSVKEYELENKRSRDEDQVDDKGSRHEEH